jgi:hypothetical protein
LTAEFDDLGHGFRIEVIAHEDTDLISPDFPGRSAAAPEFGIVHDIVVQQGGRMDELNKAAELMVVAAAVSAETGTQEEKKRPDPFAAAVQDMSGNRINQSDARIKVFPDLILDSPNLVTVRLPDVRHAVDGRSNRAVWHAADGRAEQETKSREWPSCRLACSP